MSKNVKDTYRKGLAALLVGACGVLSCHAATPSPSPALPDSVNEAAAVMIASNINMALADVFANFRSAGVDVDSAAVIGRVFQLVPAKYDAAVHRAAAERLAAEAARRAAVINDAFMADARKVQGALIMPSGVIMRTLAEGTGDSPSDSATVSFYYEGALPDGTVFDSAAAPDSPLKSGIQNFVPGLTEALQHMRKGGKYEVVIPAALAYGASGAAGVIPPDTPLKFTVELIDFN